MLPTSASEDGMKILLATGGDRTFLMASDVAFSDGWRVAGLDSKGLPVFPGLPPELNP